MGASAHAKVNLYLRVTGRRDDGYHTLDSLVVFAGAHDVVTVEPADRLELHLTGPEATSLRDDPDNLVLRAARALADATRARRAQIMPSPPRGGRGLGEGGASKGTRLTLKKNLPVASGIGGGSADAAAALRALNALWETRLDGDALRRIAATLGADVPACIESRATRMQGIGEVLGEAPALPPFGLLLANPRIALPTPSVFRARQGGFSAPAAMPAPLPDAPALADWLRPLGNDLQEAAIGLCPAVSEVLAGIAAQPGCLLARMSGSGATCFGIFPSEAAAAHAASFLPGSWWRWGGGLSAPASP